MILHNVTTRCSMIILEDQLTTSSSFQTGTPPRWGYSCSSLGFPALMGSPCRWYSTRGNSKANLKASQRWHPGSPLKFHNWPPLCSKMSEPLVDSIVFFREKPASKQKAKLEQTVLNCAVRIKHWQKGCWKTELRERVRICGKSCFSIHAARDRILVQWISPPIIWWVWVIQFSVLRTSFNFF